MILSTLRTMLPTVVSEGCAAVILRPSLRISSISSPEVQNREGEQNKRAARPGHFPPGNRERKVARDAMELGLPYLRCSSGGP